jgi:hypothetical protein
MKTVFVISNGNNGIICSTATEVRSHMTGPDGKPPSTKSITEICRQLKKKEVAHYCLNGWEITTTEIEDARPRKNAPVRVETPWRKMSVKNVKLLADIHALIHFDVKPDKRTFEDLYERLRKRCDASDSEIMNMSACDFDGVRKEMKRCRELMKKNAPVSKGEIEADDEEQVEEMSDDE